MNKLFRITTIPLSLEKLLEHQLEYMQQYYEVTAISSDEPWLRRIGEKEGVSTYTINMSRQITPFKDLMALLKLYRFLKREKPLIVHSHTPKAGIVGMLAAKLARVPIRLHTVAGLPVLEAAGSKRKLLNWVEKITYACATMVYPNSIGLKNIILKNQYTKAGKLKVIANGSSNGIDTSYFNPELYNEERRRNLKAELGIEEDDFLFVFIGRLVKDKGINELVAAFYEVSKTNQKVKLLLVGFLETELDPLSPATLAALETNKNILFVGFQKDVRPYLVISDALVFPSYREGFPNVVMQAGAMGLPSIVSDINGCNEIIGEDENGVIIPSKDENALYRAMLRFVEDGALVRRLTYNARRMIVERYEQQVVWDALLMEYKRVEEEMLNRLTAHN